MVVALQLVVHDDPLNPPAVGVHALGSPGVDARELRVVRCFTWLRQARVIVLHGFAGRDVPMLFQKGLAGPRQGDEGRSLTVQHVGREADQSLTTQMGVGAWLALRRWCIARNWTPNGPKLTTRSPDGRRLGPAKLGHPIQDAARQARLDPPAASTARSKAVSDDGLVPEEGVFHAGLLMGARGLPPSAPSERLHVGDRTIARTRARSSSRHLRRPCRRYHHPGVARVRGRIERDRVVGSIPRDAGHGASRRPDQIDAHRRVIDRRLGQRMRDDHTGPVDTQVQLLPASPATYAVFRGGPFAFTDNGQTRAVDDEMQWPGGRDGARRAIQLLTPARERRVGPGRRDRRP